MRTRNGIYHFHTHTHTHRFVCMCWICDVTHTKHRHRLANFKINITCTSNWKHKSIQWTWKIAWISGVFWFYLQKNYRLCNWMLFGHSMQKKNGSVFVFICTQSLMHFIFWAEGKWMKFKGYWLCVHVWMKECVRHVRYWHRTEIRWKEIFDPFFLCRMLFCCAWM